MIQQYIPIDPAILDLNVPYSFMEGIEEPYDVTFRDYCVTYTTGGDEYDMDNVLVSSTPLITGLEFGKKINNNCYPDATNEAAWLEYFNLTPLPDPIDETPIEE
jgi:hypothetical protein